MAHRLPALFATIISAARAASRAWARHATGARRAAVLAVAADPDVALLASAAALRRLGARITRYDLEGSLIEARDARTGALMEVRVKGSAEPAAGIAGGDVTLLRLTGEGAHARRLVRRFRTELARRDAGRKERRCGPTG